MCIWLCVVRMHKDRRFQYIKTKILGNMPSMDFGAPSGTRTLDPLIKSQLLYQLS